MVLCLLRRYLRKKATFSRIRNVSKMKRDGEYDNTRNFNGRIWIELEYILCLKQNIMLISTGMLDSSKVMDGRHHIRKRPPLIFFTRVKIRTQ